MGNKRWGSTFFNTSGSRGFTLIELLVVIAIIGILSSVVLASLNGARKKGRDARRISDIKQIQLALELYYDGNGNKYPDALSSLASTYIASVPTDPLTSSTSYFYDNLTSASAACVVSSGTCTSYILGATIEDSTNGALNSDVDGTVNTTSCVDPVYCVQP